MEYHNNKELNAYYIYKNMNIVNKIPIKTAHGANG